MLNKAATRSVASAMRLVSISVIFTFGACAQNTPGPAPKQPMPNRFPAQVIVKVAPAVGNPSSAAFIKELRAASGCSVEYVREMAGNLHLFRLPDVQGDEAVSCIKGISKANGVVFAEPDAIQKAI